jgi:hypothetical protein
MGELVTTHGTIPAASPEGRALVRRFESALRDFPQERFVTEHVIHASMYLRTIHMVKYCNFTGALIKIPTVLIVSGDADMSTGDGVTELRGYNVLPGSIGRKVAFVAHSDLDMTMVFPFTGKTVEEAQKHFTDEWSLLVPLSEPDRHHIVITGE